MFSADDSNASLTANSNEASAQPKEKLAITLLHINRAYQEVLQEKIDKLNKILKFNQQQQVLFYYFIKKLM